MAEDMSAVEKFWHRWTVVGGHHEDETTADHLLDDERLFPPAQVQLDDEEVLLKGRTTPTTVECEPCAKRAINQQPKECRICECTESTYQDLNAGTLGDVPCSYRIPKIEPYEMPAIGVYIDRRIIPGFKYKIRPIETAGGKSKWLFSGEARSIESIGRGYSRRVTLVPTVGNLNSNPDHFWTDSNTSGFAFQIQVTSPQDKFTVFDASHTPVAHLELIINQGPQIEIGQKLLGEGCIEKSVRVKALCKIEWFHEENSPILIPLSGLAVSVKDKNGVKTRIIDARLGCQVRRVFTLMPGICSSLRSVKVNGTTISDIPTSYTVFGLDAHQFPVIGTYVDPRIVTGFYYRIAVGGGGKKLWGGRALRLDSIGRGYAKRLTFRPDRLNSPENHFWSDSHPDGFGFEHSAVRPGMRFEITTGDRTVGTATVFRDDCGPQVELQQSVVDTGEGKIVQKKIQIDVKCEVSLDVGGKDKVIPHVMRLTGVAVLNKSYKKAEAEILRIEDIGLDSQLNILIVNQWHELTLYPIKSIC